MFESGATVRCGPGASSIRAPCAFPPLSHREKKLARNRALSVPRRFAPRPFRRHHAHRQPRAAVRSENPSRSSRLVAPAQPQIRRGWINRTWCARDTPRSARWRRRAACPRRPPAPGHAVTSCAAPVGSVCTSTLSPPSSACLSAVSVAVFSAAARVARGPCFEHQSLRRAPPSPVRTLNTVPVTRHCARRRLDHEGRAGSFATLNSASAVREPHAPLRFAKIHCEPPCAR